MAIGQRVLPALKDNRPLPNGSIGALRQRRLGVRSLAQRVPEEARLAFACQFTATVTAAYWQALQVERADPFPLPALPPGIPTFALDDAHHALAGSIGRQAAPLDPLAAGYQIGEVYTTALPDDLRARRGIYYTPPPLTRRLLALATAAGVDWATCRVLDPACGGGAFLTPAALAMVDALAGGDPTILFRSLGRRLRGLEIDPFSAWLSQTLLEAALLEVCQAAGQRLPRVVTVGDSLAREPDNEQFDLVIGNPPYGRVTLSEELRERYRRGLYGHANLYGVFTDLAIRWTRPGGVIAYVTPTSFLGGEYFKALRRLLTAEAPPVAIDLIAARQGVFADVLQETLLATYRREGQPRVAPVHLLVADEREATVLPAGSFTLPDEATAPWLLPRTADQVPLIARMRAMPHRLRDYGYQVSTGPLVWNRHKLQLRNGYEPGAYPLIWAESVTPDGHFVFRYGKKNHKPYFQPAAGDDWLIAATPCVLVQRTTAKEQRRRLIAAALPAEFIREHGAVVIENHLNMVRPIAARPALSPAALAALLNSDIVDEAFRCINGSVAVSAFELAALPLPAPAELAPIETLLRAGAPQAAINRAIERIYLNEAPA